MTLSEKDQEENQGFPIYVFPNEIQHIITAYNKTLNFATEFTSAAILSAVASLVGNNLKLRVKNGFDVPVHLFYITIQERGMKKSAPMNAILKPLQDINAKNKQQYDEEQKEYKRKLKEAQDNKTEFNDPEPIREQIIINRTTPEYLFKLHNENPKGILQYVNEAKEWFGTFDQYSNNADSSMWIKIWDGDIASRGTYKNGMVEIEDSCITILGTIQPDEITEFIKKNTNCGLVDRVLFDYPDKLKITSESRDEMSQNIIDNWEKLVKRMYNQYKGYNKELVQYIRYDSEALNRWYDWNEENTNKINDKDDLVYTGIVKKMETYSHRLALIIQVLRNFCEGEDSCRSVDLTSLEAAITLAEYFISQAMKVRNRVELSKTDKMSVWFSFLPENEFTTKQAYEVGKKAGVKERTVDNYLMKHPRIERADPEKRGVFIKVLS